jgi:UDP-N-acetylmuramoyl-L-alanyl-D-glutamate--2,6-diaminopimelate ligase
VIAQEGVPYLGESPFPTPAFVLVPDTRVALAEAAAGFNGHPARSLGMIGVTGTDGKTTTTHLIAHVLNATGHRAGYLSSVEFGLPGSAELNASHMTTVEAPDVQRHLAAVRDTGARYAVVEASSHGLDMHRVDQCEFDVGVFTNLTQDHLDYHETMERYRDAKAMLFRMLDQSVNKGLPKSAVLNADDAASEYMRAMTHARVMTYGLHAAADVRAHDIRTEPNGMHFAATYEGERVEARTPLLGEYNVSNCLAACAVAVSQPAVPPGHSQPGAAVPHGGALLEQSQPGAAVPRGGIAFADAVAALASFRGVPGRMEIIDEGQPFRVVVDIASTEQAMRNVLRVLRAGTTERLIVVFGAAGERDVERRSGIARAVVERADRAIITNEDPRSEDADVIIDEIARALSAAGWDEREWFERVVDRRSALARGFELARAGDTVLLAGKGTEQSIVIGTAHHPWDERAVARELLRERFSV